MTATASLTTHAPSHQRSTPSAFGDLAPRTLGIADDVPPADPGDRLRAFRLLLIAHLTTELTISFLRWNATGPPILDPLFLALGVILAIALRPGLHALFAAMAAANLLSFALVAVVSSRRTPFGMSYSRRAWSELARGAYPLALNALAITVTLRAGQIILMSLRGPVEVGFLGAASRVGAQPSPPGCSSSSPSSASRSSGRWASACRRFASPAG